MFDVLILVVKYKGEILQVDGIKDTSDSMLLSFEDSVVDAIKEDKATLQELRRTFEYVPETSYLGETEIYHYAGVYGDLEIYTTKMKISTEQILASK